MNIELIKEIQKDFMKAEAVSPKTGDEVQVETIIRE